MLPDVSQEGYDEWQQQLYTEDTDRKIQGLGFTHQANDRIADLSRIGVWAEAPTPEGPPPPAPVAVEAPPTAPPQVAPAPVEAPPEALPEPVASAAPAAAPATPPVRGAALSPTSSAPEPSSAPNWENQVFGQALGAVSRAGGDVQAFADRFGSRLSGAKDVQSVFGHALGAASAAGADVQAFADSFQPPERPVPTPSPAAPAGGSSAPTPGGTRLGQGQADFVSSLQPLAQQAAARTGIDPNVMLAIAANETGWGRSQTAQEQNNLFSIQGPSGRASRWATYASPEQSFDAFIDLVSSAPRYRQAWAVRGDAPAFVNELRKAGYVADEPGFPAQGWVDQVNSISRTLPSAKPTTAAEQSLGRTGGWAQQAAQARDISQFGDPQLTNDEAYAACGPAAAVRFAQRFGRNPSLREATDLARSVGWTSAQGMAGLGSEKALMDKLGVATKLVSGADWGTFANEARTGNPVTISTQGHYFTADGWDPNTNRFHVGRSGLDLKGGSEWMTPEQMTAIMGPVQGGLLADNPQVPAPSVADQDTNPAGWLDRTRKTMADSLSGATNVLQQGIIEPLRGALSLESTPEPRDADTARLDASVMQAASVPGGARPLSATAPEVAGAQAQGRNPLEDLGGAISGGLRNLGIGGEAAQPVNAPGGGYDPSALRAVTEPPQPGLPLRQDVRDIAQEPQPTVFQDPTLIPRVLRGPLLTSDQEVLDEAAKRGGLEEARNMVRLTTRGREPTDTEVANMLRSMSLGEAYAGTHSGEGAAPRTGAGILQNAFDRLGVYPDEVAAPIREWATSMDAPASQVGATLLRWMEENPLTSIERSVSTPATGQVSPAAARATARQAVGDLNTAIGGGRGPSMPGGGMPGQMFLEGGLPMGGARPLGAEAPGPAGGMPGQMFLEGGLPMGGPRPGGTEALPGGAMPGQVPLFGGEFQPSMVERAVGQEAPPIQTTLAWLREQGLVSPEYRYTAADEPRLQLLAQIERARQAGGGATGAAGAAGEAAGTAGEAAGVAPGINLPGYVSDSVRRIIGRSWDEMSAVTQGARTGTLQKDVLDDLGAAAKVSGDRARAVLRLDDPANVETAYALRQTLADQAVRVKSAQQALRDAPESIDATRDLVHEITSQRALQETVAGVEPRAGRALDQFRYEDELRDMAGRFKMSPDEFTRYLRDKADFVDPANVADFAKKAYGYTFKDKALAVYYFNLLSNPLTHIRNTVGNTVASLTAPVETGGAAVFDPLARKLLGDTGPRQRFIQELPAEYVGMASALPDSARQAVRRMALGVSDRATTSELTGPIGEALGGGLKNPLNYPTRLLAAADDGFRGLNEGAAHHGLANRIARQEGHTGQALTDRVAELIKRPTDEMLEQIGKVGEYRVFQQENAWANKVNNLRGDSVLGRFLIPFVKTPLNLMGYALERSPVGAGTILKDLATKGGRERLAQRGSGDLADRMSRAAIGTTIWGALAKQAFDGNLTGKMPRDPTERDAFIREGKQPNSFRSPVDGKWYSYLPLAPYSTIFGAAANVADAYRKGKIDNPDDISALGLQMGVAFAQGMADTQWTETFADALDIANGGANDPGDALTKFATRQAPNVVPGAGLLRGFARAADRTLRDPENPIEGMLAGNPFTQGNVDAQLNAWGEPIKRPIGGPEALINPFNPSTPTTEPNIPEAFDPVEKELRRLQDFNLPDFSVEPSFVGKDVTVMGQGVEMTEPQQRRYQELSGYLSKTLLDLLVGSDQYESKSDGEKAKLIKDIYETTRKSVRESMQPDLLEQTIEARVREARRLAAVSTPTATAAPTPEGEPTAGPRSGGVVGSSGGPVRSGAATSSGGPVRSSGSPVPRR